VSGSKRGSGAKGAFAKAYCALLFWTEEFQNAHGLGLASAWTCGFRIFYHFGKKGNVSFHFGKCSLGLWPGNSCKKK
jgi:hypothetical protein